jgi:hypothetical protein
VNVRSIARERRDPGNPVEIASVEDRRAPEYACRNDRQ